MDLDKRQVVDLLPDRSVESLQAWLESHPGVEVISRDHRHLCRGRRTRCRQSRHERLERVIELHLGHTQRAISFDVGIQRKTIRCWLRAGQFPERTSVTGRRSHVPENVVNKMLVRKSRRMLEAPLNTGLLPWCTAGVPAQM